MYSHTGSIIVEDEIVIWYLDQVRHAVRCLLRSESVSSTKRGDSQCGSLKRAEEPVIRFGYHPQRQSPDCPSFLISSCFISLLSGEPAIPHSCFPGTPVTSDGHLI